MNICSKQSTCFILLKNKTKGHYWGLFSIFQVNFFAQLDLKDTLAKFLIYYDTKRNVNKKQGVGFNKIN